MSWRTALSDPDLRLFVLIIAATLAASALVLLVIGRLLRKETRKLWIIWRSWLVMAPIALGALIAGRIPFIIGVGVVALFAFKEYARATGLYEDWGMSIAAYLAIAAGLAAIAIPDRDAGGGRPGWFDLLQAMPIYAVGLSPEPCTTATANPGSCAGEPSMRWMAWWSRPAS